MQTEAQPANPGLSSILMCSKCHQNPRADQDGTNPWCKECNTDYHRIYEAGRLSKMKDLGFGKGAEALRKALIEKLDGMHPTGILSVGEVKQWVAGFPLPRPE